MKLPIKKTLICILLPGCLGCTNEFNLATQKEEFILYDTDHEVKIGEGVSQQIESQYKVLTDVDITQRVEGILDKIVAVSDRKDVVYFIRVLDDEEEDIINAVSLPGGYVYLFKGLYEKVENDDQLAAVIAHEVGHITAKHAIKRLQAAYGALLLRLASVKAGGRVAGGVNFALTSLFMEYSQDAEFEADRLAVKYLKLAGYNPHEAASMLRILKKAQDKEPLRSYSYWRTHPHISQRIAIVNQEATGALEFKDYLNLIGHE